MGVFHEKDDADLRRYLAEVDGGMLAFDRDLEASIAKLAPEKAAMVLAFRALKWERIFKGPRASDEKGPIGWEPFYQANKGWSATALTWSLDELWARAEAFEHALIGAQMDARAMGVELIESGSVREGTAFGTESAVGSTAKAIPSWLVGAAGVLGLYLLVARKR